MRLATTLSFILITLGLQAQMDEKIEVNSPMGIFIIDSSSQIVFEWKTNFSYEGNFWLKVMVLDAEVMEIPTSFPDTGLLLDQEVVGSRFLYPNDAPPLRAGTSFAWQVETIEVINGSKVKGPITGVSVADLLSCEINYSGLPSSPVCPGDCFNLDVEMPGFPNFPFIEIDRYLTLYADYPNLPPGALTVDGLDVYDLSLFCGNDVEQPQVMTNQGTYGLTICVNEPLDSPIELELYYNQPSSFCSVDPCGMECCYDSESFSVEVAQVPDLTEVALEIKNLAGIGPLQEVCNADQVIFSLVNMPTVSGIDFLWQYSDDNGMSWQDLTTDPFTQTVPNTPSTFSIPANHEALSIDCANSTAGYVDRLFRTQLTAEDDPAICEYLTNEYPLRICCDLNATIDITTPDNFDLNIGLCEGDTVTIDVVLNSSSSFLNPPGDLISIQWDTNGVAAPGFDDSGSFSYQTIIGIQDLCVGATITNCAGKSLAITKCISVDPEPICGTIFLDDDEVSSQVIDGIETYGVCPGYWGTLKAIDFDLTTCTPQWEFSYDLMSWVPLGSSNTSQNTNIIIDAANPIIYYRVKCQPLNMPSGCMPCISDTIAIREQVMPPADPVLDCSTTIGCEAETVNLTVSTVDLSTVYTWYANGAVIGTGTTITYTLEKNTCFYYTATNACHSKSSASCCLDVCRVIASISCPLSPNKCAELGEPITLSGGNSESSCGGSLLYEWSWTDTNGILQTATTLAIVGDIPAPTGTTYTLMVTDMETGCSDTVTRTIIPCDL